MSCDTFYFIDFGYFYSYNKVIINIIIINIYCFVNDKKMIYIPFFVFISLYELFSNLFNVFKL